MAALDLLSPLRSSLIGALVGTACLLCHGNALADEESAGESTASEDERPKMNLSVAPNEPAVQRSAYVHNGFYFRLGVGPGYLFNYVGIEPDYGEDAHAFAFSMNALVGGSPSPGISMGGGAIVDLAPSVKYDNYKDVALHFTVGPFLDAFPNDRNGFHMGLLLGFSGLMVDKSIGMAPGGGGAGWIGYDLWVAEEWSAGIQFQAGGSYHATGPNRGSTFHSTLMLSVLRN